MTVLIGVAAGAALAAGENAAFKDSPILRFTAADSALMRDAVRKALAVPEAGGEAVSWRNESGSASGSAALVARETWQSMPCRQLRIVNTHKRQSAEGVYRFCQSGAGTWKLVGPVAGPR